MINLVIDNHAQWFIAVPGAYNLVQGPSNYHNLLRMGVPADRLVLAGHWIPKVRRRSIYSPSPEGHYIYTYIYIYIYIYCRAKESNRQAASRRASSACAMSPG